ncbi:late competence development ComFB family protein [uncultured Ferrimonas sp.]|uniref:late competence development ComFB family protein n=1 Tax=uncultured Ferrimonas sp. TaxID=432640 RepID=UPI002620E6CA|nr:late competence development ComFB family protein [uncultured Ferrimonas sp.]
MEWDIRNYYEYLVKQAIVDRGIHKTMNEDELLDLVCLALNKLPARYIRFHVDMANYLAGEQRQAMDQQVDDALAQSLQFLAHNPRQE